ncbi:MAG TPA: phosphatase PAP2 family protein [Flavobacterium sp.]|uniref:phosphatase PAP2 family protein n=1 Tax=Flavobacterium sp. TaxID=239 RepID=UPI002C68219A|nr:phosphatase PAP2 family protein [Flavobacterium sp.]HNP33905.1 phosphatase PAP2 family protein [Flavobacterium sp.]
MAFLFLVFQLGIAQSEQHPADSLQKNHPVLYDSILKRKVQQYQMPDRNTVYQFPKPKIWDMFRYIPNDIYGMGKFTVQKENLKWDALALGSTLAILPFDQKIADEADVLGEKLGGWNKDSHYEKLFGVLNIIPQNIPSAVYYMGNGGTTLLLSWLFYGIGKFSHNDYRALNTSNELVECLFSVGITTQTLKHITGRQSPSRAIPDGNNGGAWNPFPSLPAFQQNEPNYDAMPSGHIATFMATVTIISTNYPEIKWIKPVGYSLMSVLAFNMVSGKVHWASDYPIGIFIGYVMGKEIANRRIKKIPKDTVGFLPEKPKKYKFDYNINNYYKSTLIGATLTF